jgi:hypothetical protein
MHISKQSRRYLLLAAIASVAVVTLGAAPAVVRSLTAGFGLTGGGAGDVTLAVDPAVIQTRVNGACGAGSAIAAIAANGTVTCRPTGTLVTAFVHRASSATIPEVEPWMTLLDYPLLNGDADAIVTVTSRVVEPGGANLVDPHPIAVAYTTTDTCPGCAAELLDKWAIVNADSTVMTVDAAFNVLVVKQ